MLTMRGNFAAREGIELEGRREKEREGSRVATLTKERLAISQSVNRFLTGTSFSHYLFHPLFSSNNIKIRRVAKLKCAQAIPPDFSRKLFYRCSLLESFIPFSIIIPFTRRFYLIRLEGSFKDI